MKLKQKDLATYRMLQLQKQMGICPLCLLPIGVDSAVADHDHKSGHIRSILHRNCNRSEGKVNRWTVGKTVPEKILSLQRMIAYWQDSYEGKFISNPIYPTHK